MTYYPANSVDTNHFMNVPWKINGSIRGEERERVGVGGGGLSTVQPYPLAHVPALGSGMGLWT